MTLYSEGNYYLRGVLASKGGVVFIYSKNGYNTIIEKGSTYAGNVASRGGAIYCINCVNIQLSSPAFYQCVAYQGGALYLEYTHPNIIVPVTVDNF